MSKYIKLDDAIDYECPFNEIWEDCIGCPLNDSAIETCKMGKWLKSLPTIEVVRCIDCIYNTLNTDGVAESWCYKHGINIEVDDYCSYGEKQVASKLNNADDSLLTEDTEECKEKKSKLESDLISRQEAIEALGEEPDIALDTEEEWAERNAWATHVRAIKSLPSAEPKIVEDTISRQATIEAIEERFFAGTVADINPSWRLLHEIIESLPSVGSTLVCEDAISRAMAIDLVSKYHRAFAYNSDVDELIVELETLPSSEPERPKGEWITLLDGNEWFVYCSKCKTQYHEEDLLMGGSKLPNFCPDCGSYNGGENEM